MVDAPRLILVDGSGYIFRAYHGLPPLTRRDGTPVGAVYGFTTMLLKLREQFKHDMLAVIFDAGRATFRNEIYPDYKANRPPAPEDLIPQFPLVREATRALNIPAIELSNYEADDLIASYTHAARAAGQTVVIVSSDKDLMQLVVDGAVSMLDPMKNRSITSAEVREKFGVGPEKVIEVQALIGDAVDHVPGVPGIGPKTAAELIGQYGDLEGVLANLAHITQPKRRETLTTHAQNARLSRQLVELKCDVPLPMPLEALITQPFDSTVLLAFLEQQNFTSLVKKFGGGSVSAGRHPGLVAGSPETGGAEFGEHQAQASVGRARDEPGMTPTSYAQLVPNYTCITTEETLAQWLAEATAAGVVAIDTETTSLNAVEAELVGISLAVAPGRACYIPLGHVGEGGAAPAQSGLFDAPAAPAQTLVEGQLPLPRVLDMLAPLLANPGVLKVGHNIKYDLVVLEKYGVICYPERSEGSGDVGACNTLSSFPLADTMLMSYCLSAGLHAQGLDFLAQHHFGHRMISYDAVTGTGKARKSFAQVSLADATNYAAEDADFTLRLYERLKHELPRQQVANVYETIERPLIPVIVAMECAGVMIDPAALTAMSSQFGFRMDALEREIVALAGMPFSVSSPKQLGEVLFEKMQLPGGKKSAKTGAYGTDAGVLEELTEQGIPIAAKVLEWRQYAKLKNTYTDALPKAISPRDGRVHTSYAMAITTTGRLSSSEPNLQNIPIRTEEGKRIRTAFVAPPGCVLLSADYSQIELRLLAHVAGIDTLKQAFHAGADIHALTASQMFGVPLASMTPELRRRAKAINFGIIYGISAHGLSLQLGISRAEAGDYIASYFKQYPGIRAYMDSTIAFAREHGYVQTLFGRRVHVKDIHAKNQGLRQFSERAAINAPLQGTAADIIKRAMVTVDETLRFGDSGCKNARLLLQVHDELVIECNAGDATTLKPLIKRAMEGAAQLSVPLTVEIGEGSNWGDAH